MPAHTPASLHWRDLESNAPEIAAIGTRLLVQAGTGEVAILATVDHHGAPCAAPVCPIFCAGGIYLSVAARTPKARHLHADGRYTLHAQVNADDLEFQISGRVRLVQAAPERRRVHDAIVFSEYNKSDPLVELLIHSALAVHWPLPGKSEKLRWRPI